ncbi:MAG: hypothetical protein EPN89_10445 [Methylovulum sp.]|nr:MAG: hypothetical protein EPN89_10445 [Methylovulum sp.]
MQSTPEAIKAYLPESLHDMMAVISLQSLLILIKTQGGTRVIIPKNAKPDHWLVELSGSRYFCESLFWVSQPKQAAKITRPLMPAAPQPS